MTQTTNTRPTGINPVKAKEHGTVTLANGSVRRAIRTTRESGAVSIFYAADPAKPRSRSGAVPAKLMATVGATFAPDAARG